MKKVAFLLFLVLSYLVVAGMHTCFVRANFLNEPQKISVILQSPDNKTYAPNNIRLTFRVSHWVNFDIDTWITLDDQAPARVYLSNYHGSLGTSIYDSTITGLKDGSHVIRIRASSGEVYNTAEVFFTIDSAPPTILNISVENKTYTKTDLPLNYTVNEQTSWIGYSLDNQPNATIKGHTTLSELAYGYHNLVVYANDTAGNMCSSETITFTITKPPESYSAIITVASTLILAFGIGLIVYFRKHKRKAA